MHDKRNGRRASALFAAFLAGTVATASMPAAVFAEQPTTKGTKAPSDSAAKKKSKSDEDAKRAEARRHFDDAEAKFAAGDFVAAYAEYKAANDAMASPQALFKMAAALDKGGKAEEAIAAYNAYLAAAAGDEAKTSEAQARITELKRALPVTVTIKTTPPGASVTIDGQPVNGVTPIETKLPPGSHAFQYTLSGYDLVEKQASVSADAASVDAVLTKTAPATLASAPAPSASAQQPPGPRDAAEPEPEHRSNATAYVLLGVTAACLGVGTVFGIKALQAKSDFDNGLKTSEQADTVEQYALVSDLVFGTALTLGVTGAVLLVSNANRPQTAVSSARILGAARSSPSLQIVPSFGPHHAAAAAKIHF